MEENTQNLIIYIRSSLVRIVFLLVASVFLSVSGYNAYQNYRFLQTAKRAQGIVIGYEQHSGNSKYPVVRFSTKGTDSLTFTSEMSTDPPAFEVGEKVEVLYETASPDTTPMINSWSQLWLLWVIFAALALVFYSIVFGGFLLYRMRLARQQNNELFYQRDQKKATSEQLRQRMAEIKAQAASYTNRWLYVFPAVGVLLLCIAGVLAWQHQRFIATAPQYDAVVSGYEQGKRVHYPIFEFVDEKGDNIRAFSSTGQNPAPYAIGERVHIYYDPSDHTAVVAGSWSEWLGTMIVGGIGILFLIIGIPMVWQFRKG